LATKTEKPLILAKPSPLGLKSSISTS
jgi:hypothetical protein